MARRIPGGSRHSVVRLAERHHGLDCRIPRVVLSGNFLALGMADRRGARAAARASVVGDHFSGLRRGLCRVGLAAGIVFARLDALHADRRLLDREHEHSFPRGHLGSSRCSCRLRRGRVGIFLEPRRTNYHAVSRFAADGSDLRLSVADTYAVRLRHGRGPDRQRALFLSAHGAEHDCRFAQRVAGNH